SVGCDGPPPPSPLRFNTAEAAKVTFVSETRCSAPPPRPPPARKMLEAHTSPPRLPPSKVLLNVNAAPPTPPATSALPVHPIHVPPLPPANAAPPPPAPGVLCWLLPLTPTE